MVADAEPIGAEPLTAARTTALTADELDLLTALAAQAVVDAALGREPARPEPPAGPLGERRAAFVTLLHRGELRGCIGGLVPERPLVHEVVLRAVAASRRDPRFAPVRPDELTAIEVEVSVLSSPETVVVSCHAELIEVVRPGVDGLIVSARRSQATLLPSVWQHLPDPTGFVDALWAKAGLRRGDWPRDVQVQRYTAERGVARRVVSEG